MTSPHVVIVGASVGGITCAEALRAEGFEGRITVVGEEDRPPYNRPPLSKQVLTGEWQPDQAGMLPTGDLAAIDVDLRLGIRATRLDVAAHRVDLESADGPGDGSSSGPRAGSTSRESLSYDSLIIATGVRPRRLSGVGRPDGVHELRTLADAEALRDALVSGARAVVVGAGILGSEVAAVARKKGVDVTLVGRSDRLRFGQVGDRLSDRLAGLHRDNGVCLIAGCHVTGIAGSDRLEAVTLSDGRVVPAELVVTAIGCTPAVDWLAGSGLDLADGVVCDSSGRAAADVYAVGDVASWRNDDTGVASRAEHQLGAIEQGHAVALLLATGQTSPRPQPFFWSELFGARIQAYGTFAAGGQLTVVAGDDSTGSAADRFVAESRSPDGVCVGIVGWNLPREFRLARARVGSREGAGAGAGVVAGPRVVPTVVASSVAGVRAATPSSSTPTELVGASKGPLS